MKLVMAVVAVVVMAGSSCFAAFTGEKLNRPFTVHGRLSSYNGSALTRIWIVGSTRMLNVAAPSASSERIQNIFADGQGWFTRDIYGDFTVEPLKKDIKGHMRPVRIVGVKNVVIKRAGKVVARKKSL